MLHSKLCSWLFLPSSFAPRVHGKPCKLRIRSVASAGPTLETESAVPAAPASPARCCPSIFLHLHYVPTRVCLACHPVGHPDPLHCTENSSTVLMRQVLLQQQRNWQLWEEGRPAEGAAKGLPALRRFWSADLPCMRGRCQARTWRLPCAEPCHSS